MKRPKSWMPKSWQPYLIFASIQLANIILCSSAWHFYRQHADDAQSLLRQLAEVQTQQRAWIKQQALLNDYLPRYHKLVQTHHISPPQPRLWLQQLKHIQQSQHLYPLQYTISKPQPYKTGFDGVQAVTSNMKFEMDLLHEEDLLTLLQGLQASHAGGFALRSCKLNALRGTLELQQLKPNLHAKCELDWRNILPVTGLDDGQQ